MCIERSLDSKFLFRCSLDFHWTVVGRLLDFRFPGKSSDFRRMFVGIEVFVGCSLNFHRIVIGALVGFSISRDFRCIFVGCSLDVRWNCIGFILCPKAVFLGMAEVAKRFESAEASGL